MRLAPDQDRVAAFEPTRGEVGDNAALQLAPNAVRGEYLGDDEKVWIRRRRDRLACLCAWRRL
jgi:hypothetical protein